MKLNRTELERTDVWANAGFTLPKYDIEKICENTRKEPTWVHFGAGNIFRAFPATLLQRILDEGDYDRGVIVAEGHDFEIIDSAFIPHDNLSITVTLNSDGSIEKTVVGSIVEALKADASHRDFERLKEIFRAPTLQMVSFTITEKGYSLLGADGELSSIVLDDFQKGPQVPQSYMGKVASLLYTRYLAGSYPVAFVSMDNYSHNGDILAASIRAYADAWSRNGLVEQKFTDYVASPTTVGFPCSMIDKITPRPAEVVKELLAKSGFDDAKEVVTSKGMHVAPFVNAEKTQYLVIENVFPNGHPPLERGGVIFTDRETVDKVEAMKVSFCLNCLHLALGIFGSLLAFERISDEMKDPDLRRMVKILGYDEGLPVAVNPGIIDPKAFLNEVLSIRFPNPFVPDTPQRITVDCSQKFSTRLGPTVIAYMNRGDLGVSRLKIVPLVQAAWCRYLLGIDDTGKTFVQSPDPMLSELQRYVEGIALGDQGSFHRQLQPILSNEKIFGVDLYQAGLGERIEDYFAEMVAKPGAVRATLRKYTSA